MTDAAPMPRRGIVAVTGATGLIGRALCRHLARAGWVVRALARRPEAVVQAAGISAHRLELPGTIGESALAGCDALVHAAYVTRASRRVDARAVNEDGTVGLLQAARRAGVARSIFLSTLAAHPNAPSYYALSKFRIEQLLDPDHDLALRPGLVLSLDGGLFARFASSARRFPVVPLLSGGIQPVQTVHIDDLCLAIEAALRQRTTGTLTIAHPQPVTMRKLAALTAAAVGRRQFTLPVPAWLVLFSLRAFEGLGVTPPVSTDNVRGLLASKVVDSGPDLARLGLKVRSTEQSLRDLAAARMVVADT